MARRVEMKRAGGSECLESPDSQRVPEKKGCKTCYLTHLTHLTTWHPDILSVGLGP